jgi:FAM183A and FAM183B related
MIFEEKVHKEQNF